MLTHLIELVILSFITCILISKLIAILGNVDEEEVKRRQNTRSYFGEPSNLKDVTNTGATFSTAHDVRIKQRKYLDALKIDKIIAEESSEHIIAELEQLTQKMPGFDLTKFYDTAVNVIKIIIKSTQNIDHEVLSSLLDKRFIEPFKQMMHKYNGVDTNGNLDVRISNIYALGNNYFIKMTVNIFALHCKEEWIFNKNISISSPRWYLSNIEIIK